MCMHAAYKLESLLNEKVSTSTVAVQRIYRYNIIERYFLSAMVKGRQHSVYACKRSLECVHYIDDLTIFYGKWSSSVKPN